MTKEEYMNTSEVWSTSSLYISARREMKEEFATGKMYCRLIPPDSKEMISLYEATEEPKRMCVSYSCKEIMGYDPEEMIGLSAYEFILPEDAERLRNHVHPTTLSGKSAVSQYRAIKKDGSVIWLESISNPIFDDQNKMIGFQTSARDITQQKIFEQELIAAKKKTEDASAQLKELLAEKNDLIGLLSHDMKSPVNQIKGLTRLMTMSLDDKETLRLCLEKIDQTIHNQDDLLRSVLSMLKTDQMTSEPEPFETVTLLSLVKIVKQTLEWDLKNKNLTLFVEISEPLEIMVQRNFFVQAMLNLISNSIKFSHPGKEIIVKAEKRNDATIITVLDQGVGFEPEKAEQLFNKFTKEGRRGTNNESSTGLGLYLVKKIIRNHHGTIVGCSEGEGKGALFTIRLPNSPSKSIALDRFRKDSSKPKEGYILPQNKLGVCAPFFFIRANYREVKIFCDDVLYIEGLKDYVKIFLVSQPRPIFTRKNMKGMESILPLGFFFRIHNSFIVNVSKISSFQKAQVFIGRLPIPIGEKFASKFEEYYRVKPD